jgi:outer membrane protein TolC
MIQPHAAKEAPRRGARPPLTIFAALLSCLAVAMAVGAEGVSPTLREVVAAAYTRLPQRQTLEAEAGEVEALARRSDSLIADSPSIDTGYRTDQVGSRDGYREWEAGMALPLWKPGQRHAEQELARRAASVLDHRSSVLMLAVAGEVRERIWNTARAQNNLELAQKEWDTAVSLEGNVERRVQLGELAKMDLLLARDATLSKRAAYLRAQTDFENAKRRYVSYTGMTRLPEHQGEKLSPLIAVAETHPELAEARAGVERAQAQLASTRHAGAGSPMLFLGGSGERDDSDSDFNNRLGLSLSLPPGQKHRPSTTSVIGDCCWPWRRRNWSLNQPRHSCFSRRSKTAWRSRTCAWRTSRSSGERQTLWDCCACRPWLSPPNVRKRS